MLRTVSLKLVDPPVDELRRTMNAFRDACQFISICVQEGAPLNRGRLHRVYYKRLREQFLLPSQMAQSVIRVVIGTYRAQKSKTKSVKTSTFRRPQVQFQFNRDWSFSKKLVSLRTLDTRRRLQFRVGSYQQQKYLDDTKWKCGGARLIERRGHFYLNITLGVESTCQQKAVTPVGIDRGIRTLAVARVLGKKPLIVRGGRLLDYRYRMLRIRRRLQAKGTRSARRMLRHLKGREKRFVLDFCRRSAKTILQYVQKFKLPIVVLENLTDIRTRANARGKKYRRQLHSWPFLVLKQAITNLVEELSIPVANVDPAYTSQRCPSCGIVSKYQRQRDNYCCQHCQYQNNSDVVAATNIDWLWLNDVDRIKPGVPSTIQTCRIQRSDAMYKPPISIGGS